MLKCLVAEGDVREDIRVGQEADLGSGAARIVFGGIGAGGDDVQRIDDFAAGEGDQIDLAVLYDLDLGPFGQGVDAFHAHAVQTTGDFVDVVVEFSAGVELGHDDLDGGPAADGGVLMNHGIDGHASAVVDHRA